MSDVVIKAENLSKYYKLGVINNGTFFKDMQTWLALKTGKPDPHSRIGENKYDPTKEGFWALKDLNFEIHQGDRVGIIGKNGAGKSTLLKILSRITAPTEGDVKIKGRVASLLEVGTGFHGELTGRENIFLNGAILGMKKREVQRKLDEIIAFSEIEQHIDTPVKRYSSGMYVRLAFAVAAHLDSEILIADEVLAVGDAAFQKKALGKMNELSTGEGRTVLFVSHQMAAVKNLCNKGIVLEKGAVVRQDDDINESINWYLYGQSEESKKNITHWTNDGTYGNEYFIPINFKIINADENKNIDRIDAKDKLEVHLEFEIKTVAANLSFEFYLKDSSDTIIFSFSPFYSIENYKPKIGRNFIYCEIPQNFLNDKLYFLELRASLFCQECILIPGYNTPTLQFKIENKFSFNPYIRESEEALAPFISFFNK